MEHRDELVVILNTTDEVQTLLYKTMLEEAGIDVLERPMEPSWFEGVMLQGLHSQLLVRAEDEERATALIEDFAREAAEGDLATSAMESATPADEEEVNIIDAGTAETGDTPEA